MGTALATTNNQIEFTGLRAEQRNLGNIFIQSGFFSDVTKGSQAMVKIIAGQELGLEPFSAMQNLFIVKGKIQISGNAIAGKIKSSGKYNYKIKVSNKEICLIEFYENGELQGEYGFSLEDAKRIGLTTYTTKSGSTAPNPIWNNYPRTMLFNRAISGGYKIFCPDIFNYTVYTEADGFEEIPTKSNTILDEEEDVEIVAEIQESVIDNPMHEHTEQELSERELILQEIRESQSQTDDIFTSSKRNKK